MEDTVSGKRINFDSPTEIEIIGEDITINETVDVIEISGFPMDDLVFKGFKDDVAQFKERVTVISTSLPVDDDEFK